uniref:Uncharacterized protein n=1 Tax=Anguilla anguilla TaxID=7936 RepID=A0A0E9XDP9_ANGAN
MVHSFTSQNACHCAICNVTLGNENKVKGYFLRIPR